MFAANGGFISTIARRLDSLGALTRGQRQTGGQNLFDPADNLESIYAKDALVAGSTCSTKASSKPSVLTAFKSLSGLKNRNRRWRIARRAADHSALAQSHPRISDPVAERHFR
jgi:hypothetical protein